MELTAIREAFLDVFSQIFPTTLETEVHVDASESAESLFVDVLLRHGQQTYRLNDLEQVPARIKIGRRSFKVSRKNRHTLKALADWDPVFDPKRGFVFPEKDVPEVLSYLRAKATVALAPNARQIRVDNRPLQRIHNVEEKGQHIEIRTALTDPDGTVRIENASQARFVENSQFAHAPEGYFKKPADKKYKTFRPEIGTSVLSGDQIPLFLLYDLKKLQADSRTHVEPRVLAQRVITESFTPKVSLHVDGPWLWFDVRYEAERFKVQYETIEKLSARQEFVRKEDTWIKVDRDVHKRVANQIDRIPELDRVEAHFRTPTRNYYEVQNLLAAVAHIDFSQAYARFIQSLADFTQIEEQPLPYSLRQAEKVRTYQRHGYDWLCFLNKYGLNGILADEMGLGKTLQTLACLLEAHSKADAGTSLIICPPSALSAWEDDLRKFTSPTDFRVGRYLSTNRNEIIRDLKHYDCLLTTYTIVRNDIDTLSRVAWEYVVLDEAQKIKNYETATAKACKNLIVKHKLAVTGTPIENRLSELWSLYDFLMPSYLRGYTHFRETFEIPIMKHGSRQATNELKKKIGPFKLRRLKSQVETELPEKIYLDRYCELTPEQVQLYREYALREQDRIKQLPGDVVRIDTTILEAILRLKQICCHPALIKKNFEEIYERSGKLQGFVEILEELAENEEKALIFSQFTGMLEILQRVLRDKQLNYFYLDGSTSLKARQDLKDRFQKGEVPFFLISLRAGGVGMTLTEANCVVHYDRWWNPAVEDQATDRVHRIGQDKPVKMFRIHTVGTIDERISELLVKKKDLFDAVIDVDDLKKEVTKDQLLALFEPPR